MGYGIEFPDSVDLVTFNDAKQYVKLVVVGPEVWSGLPDETEQLACKLDSYLNYVESGQLYNAYPQVSGYDVIFQVDTSTTLPPSIRQWIEGRRALLRNDHSITLDVAEL